MKIHFIAIGGTGMGALAGLLADAGHEVRGSDLELYPPMSLELEQRKIPVFRGFRGENLDWGPDVVVVGNVCRKDHVEVLAAQSRGLTLESFPSLLRKTLLEERRSLVIAGTHGKTTTASLAAFLLQRANMDPSFLIGGVAPDLGHNSHLGRGEAIVIEGDEYDTAFFDKGSKFLHYRPSRAVLTSVEFDHADIFSGIEQVRSAFAAFVATIPKDGELIVHLEDSEAMGVAATAQCRVITYRVLAGRDRDTGSADYVAVETSNGIRCNFELFEQGRSLGEFSTQLLGRHNLSNVVAAVALARREGAEIETLRDGVRRFRGVKRRQELLGVAQGVRIIEDFAHHPTAVQLTLRAIRKRWPDGSLHVCFDARSATSRRKVFAAAYGESFDAATQVYIGPLFNPEAIPPEDRLDPKALAEAISGRGVPSRAFDSVEDLAATVLEQASPGDTVLVLSCGSFGGLPHKLLHGLGDPVMFANPEDDPAIAAIRAHYGILAETVSEGVETLVIREPAGNIVGCVSIKLVGEQALLLGLAVTPGRRGEGLGWVLGDSVIRRARTLGARRMYLITSTAADFFATKLGFRPVQEHTIDPILRDDASFRAAARASGVCMALDLSSDPQPLA